MPNRGQLLLSPLGKERAERCLQSNKLQWQTLLHVEDLRKENSEWILFTAYRGRIEAPCASHKSPRDLESTDCGSGGAWDSAFLTSSWWGQFGWSGNNASQSKALRTLKMNHFNLEILEQNKVSASFPVVCFSSRQILNKQWKEQQRNCLSGKAVELVFSRRHFSSVPTPTSWAPILVTRSGPQTL